QYFQEETEDTYIEIYESSYSSSITKAPWFSNQGMPYKITGLIQFQKDLTINNGVKMYFEQDAGIKVKGKLTVSGNSTDPVIMDGVSPGTASWRGIWVDDGQVDISYCSVLNGGNNHFSGLAVKASLTVEQLLSMKNSTISGSGGTGLYMPGNAHIQFADNFSGNTIENNDSSAVRVRMDDVNKVVNGNTISSSTGIPAIEVHMGIDDPLGTWVNLDADYDYKVLESLTIKATKDLTVEAGATMKMSMNSVLQVNGGLIAVGTSGSKITIEGTESKAGHWDGIILNGTQKVQLDFMNILDGGGAEFDKANLIVKSTATDVSVTNSSIKNSKGYGVLIKAGASEFGINDPASKNTLEGNLGGFHVE
ncbi:right-handed parallel beta-helix repeat-containing protein, partial [Bacteroidota bacterium]